MPNEHDSTNLTSFDTEPTTGASSRDEVVDSHLEGAKTVGTSPTVAVPVTPPQDAPTSTDASLPQPGPGLLVLQWLVYALWGWTVLVLSGLIALVISQLFSKDDSGLWDWHEGIAYLLAAVVVLFVMALSCDIFYARAERKHARSTGSNVVMIIHAVIFALCGIGALITSVFSAVSLLIDTTGDTNSAVAGIISGAIIFGLYGLTLLRTLRPKWVKAIPQLYWAAMSLVIVTAVILGIVGPVAQARLAAEDAVIERALPSLAGSINEYTQTNGVLPANLKDVRSLDHFDDAGEVKRLIDEGKVEYKPGDKLAPVERPVDAPLFNRSELNPVDNPSTEAVYHYQLCVDYKRSSGEGTYRVSYLEDGEKYPIIISTYDHRAGHTCYDIQTDYLY